MNQTDRILYLMRVTSTVALFGSLIAFNGGANAQSATGTRSVALGPGSQATSGSTVAIGDSSTAEAASAIAIGRSSLASGQQESTAIGAFSNASANGSLALGARSKTDVIDSVALGYHSIGVANNNTNGVVPLITTGPIQVQYNNASNQLVGAVSVGNSTDLRQVKNMADGSAATDAVTVSQLSSVASAANMAISNNGVSTAAALGGGASYDPTTGLISNPGYGIQGNQYSNVGEAFGAVDTSVTNLNTSVNALGATVTNMNNGGGIKYFHTNSTLADSSATGLDSVAIGPAASATGENSIAVGANAVSSSDGAIALGQLASASIVGGVALGQGSVSNRENAAVSGKLVVGTSFVSYDTTNIDLLGAVSVGNAETSSYRQITNVADGTQAQDVVTIRQLQGALASVSQTGTLFFHGNSTQGDSLAVGADSVAVGPTTVVNGDNGIGIGNGAIVAEDAVGGVAIGRQSQVLSQSGIAIGTEAQSNAAQGVALGPNAEVHGVAGVALGSTSQANGAEAIAIGNDARADGAGDVAIGAGSIANRGPQTYTGKYSGAANNTAGAVSVGSPGIERAIVNVADGSEPTDAVNLRQLDGAIAQQGQYIDGRLQDINNRLQTNSKDADGGTATAIAMASLPQPTTPGKNMVSVGSGSYQSQTALALGISRVTTNNKWVLKGALALNSRGKTGFGLGAGYQW